MSLPTKKLYGDFTKSDWLRVSQMSESDVPDAIILHGEDGNIAENIAEWEPVFEQVISRPRWNMFVGSRGKKKIGFVNVCWAPMAALIVHKLAAMGTKRFVQIGYCGGLTPELRYGEILVVSSAKSEDGVATQYFPGILEFQSSPSLLLRAKEHLERESLPHRTGRVVSTSAMFLETSALVQSWSHAGFIGIDGETATTLAVASKFNAEAISLLTCSDNLSIGDNFYESDAARVDAEETAFENIQKLALQIA